MLRSALRIGFRSTAGPSDAWPSIAVEPRAYQYVPLLLALRQDVVRLLIADDVGIGKTIEAGLIAAECCTVATRDGVAVLCSPALAEQWQRELRDKFGIEAELVLPSTVGASNAASGARVALRALPSHGRSRPTSSSPPGGATSSSVPAQNWSSSTKRTPASPTRRRRLGTHPALRAASGTSPQTATGTWSWHRHPAQREGGGVSQPARAARPRAGHRRPGRPARPRAAGPPLRSAPPGRYPPVPRRRHAVPEGPAHQRDPYTLSPEYRALFDKVLDYARETVRQWRRRACARRVRWWSALALLRALASSPRAAAHTLRTRQPSAAAGIGGGGRRARPGRACSTRPTTSRSRPPTPRPGADPDETFDQNPKVRRLRGFLSDAQKL